MTQKNGNNEMTQKVTSKRKQYKKQPKGNDTKQNNGKETIQ